MSKNLIMVDHAIHDKRSFAAMLHGSGDNREQVFLNFEARFPEFKDQEVLMEFFVREVRYGRILPSNIFTNSLSRKWYLALTILVIAVL